MRKISVSDEFCSFFEEKYELKLFGCFVLIKITCKTLHFLEKVFTRISYLTFELNYTY